VIDAHAVSPERRLSAYDKGVVREATYAVTVEPEGGSPTGAPSGAPVFVGKLIPVGP
jgi:anti-sigma-K factor RskA